MHTDDMNDFVLMGLARDSAEAEVKTARQHLSRLLLICEGVPLNAVEASKWVKEARAYYSKTEPSDA